MKELSRCPSTYFPLHVEKKGAEALGKNPEYHSLRKHIQTQYHFVRECVKNDPITLNNVTFKDMLADMMKKPLNCVLLEHHRCMFDI